MNDHYLDALRYLDANYGWMEISEFFPKWYGDFQREHPTNYFRIKASGEIYPPLRLKAHRKSDDTNPPTTN